MAILLALEHIKNSEREHYVIFTDSLSCLLAIENHNITNQLIAKILDVHHNLPKKKAVKFLWVPSHIGIRGNKKADSSAKDAINNPIDPDVQIPYTDMKSLTNQYIKIKMQSNWDSITENKLKNIKPKIGCVTLQGVQKREEETKLHRLRIGHTYLTHKYLLAGEDRPTCTDCQCPLTTEHVLIDCPSLDTTRQKYYTYRSLSEVFDKVPGSQLLEYTKEIGIYAKI